MRHRILTLASALLIAVWGFTGAAYAIGSDPLEIGVKETPSESFLSSSKRSIGASTESYATTLSASPKTVVRASDASLFGAGWSDPFLVQGDGWQFGETGNVGAEYTGMPLGDASFPILLSMLILYFLYRGVSSSKRKSNL